MFIHRIFLCFLRSEILPHMEFDGSALSNLKEMNHLFPR
jgi:hypothetical protein